MSKNPVSDGPRQAVTAHAKGQSQPVVLLHGLFRTSRSMGTAARWLAAQGWEAHNLGYRSRRENLEALASAVAAELNRRFEHDRRRVHFLTHSMGGILVRTMLALDHAGSLDRRWSWGRVVMLAPPNQGSRLAQRLGELRIYRWLFGPAGQELRLREDCCLPSLPTPKSCGVIAGTRSVGTYRWVVKDGLEIANDGTVNLEEVNLGQTPVAQVPAGHTFIMNSREALELADIFLRSGRFPRDS